LQGISTLATVLIVDDNPIDRRRAAGVVEKVGMKICFAEHGKEALEIIAREPPDVVLTDLLMPEMDGLELVERIKQDYPATPVILMTAHGSEEIAVKALRTGAANYVPKGNLSRDLVHTIREVLTAASIKRDEQRALACLRQAELYFTLGVENSGHEPLVGFLQGQLRTWRLCGDADLIRIGTALHEAFVNAVEHGNLELDSDLRNDPDGAYQRMAEARRLESPYRDRKVQVRAHLDRDEVRIIIRDEGPGFDPSCLPDPTVPENIGKISGRGLLLIRTFMDDVRFNETGNEIVLVKKKAT
jgi:CheY-like chemotaxis protein/anti-sigma regulatory factor (Ser/Thr protein kinase)